jgi:hypothetical protein
VHRPAGAAGAARARNIAKIAAAHPMLDIVYYTLREGTSRVVRDAT